MLTISEIKISGIEDVEKRLGNMRRKAPEVVSRAINRAATTAQKNAAQETAKIYYIKSGDVRSTIKIVKSSKSNLKAAVISSGYKIALSKFRVSPKTRPRPTKRGYSPKVYKAGVEKAGGMKALDGNPKAFITTLKSGHVGMFERESDTSLPIKQLFGPAVPQMIGNEKTMKKINKEANETLEKRINHEIENILRRG